MMPIAKENFRIIIYFAILAAASIGVYLLVSLYTYRIGFPLDDAWIHQTYARNLSESGEWAFLPGQPSAGSTAPLWSGLLAIGHTFGLGPYIWTYILGWGLLVAMAILGSLCFRYLYPENRKLSPWAGVLLLFEWHLVWAGASGMETLLFSVIALLVMTWLVAGWGRWFTLGAVVGLSIWIRPDGITLLGPAIFVLLLSEHTWTHKGVVLARLTIGFLGLFALYLLFNQILAGSWWPNTFYAKQAEYAVELRDPLWWRIWEQASLPLIGVGVILLPGFIRHMRIAFNSRLWNVLGGGIWAVGYLLLYALRLPVTYQHGRYIMPMMPVFFLWGFAGSAGWVNQKNGSVLRRVLSKTWILSIGLILIIFWINGAKAYGRDVSVIESEMVKTAHWVAHNTESNALIAAHDIGALGYFSERQILDLAGLVSPEVIPFIREETRLEVYLNARGADYLVTFPGWYPDLVKQAGPIFNTGEKFSPALGGENMYVYRWSIKLRQ